MGLSSADAEVQPKNLAECWAWFGSTTSFHSYHKIEADYAEKHFLAHCQLF